MWLIAVTLLGCQRSASPGDESGAKASTASSARAADARGASDAKAVPDARAEEHVEGGVGTGLPALPSGACALRTTAAQAPYGALLEPVRDAVKQRFAGVADADLRLQVAPLPGDGRAVLIDGAGGRPLMVGFDRQGQVSWLKERVIHDLDPTLGRLRLCAGGGGDLVLVFHDPPTHSLAARRWDAGGGLLADFRLGDVEHPDALEVVPWPAYGWLVVTSTGGSLRAQMLTYKGALPWGIAGRTLDARGVLAGPVHVALDTDVSALLVWPGPGATGRHFRASRIDLDGRDLWKTPIDLGDAAEGPVELRRTGTGEVRAELYGKSGQYTVNVTADGRVLIQ